MAHKYYSQRKSTNPNPDGLPIEDIVESFSKVYRQLENDGYFDEAFGFRCVGRDRIEGSVKNIELEILVTMQKQDLWPISKYASEYTEDNFLDVIEFLYQYVSKPIDGTPHSYYKCMHWETFNKKDGQNFFREKINILLEHYKNRFELSQNGEVLHKPEKGFEPLLNADVPSKDSDIVDRVKVATTNFRRHGSSLDDRRKVVRDLVDVLEYLRPKVKKLLTKKDENDLFNIANNFGIRHNNDKQKTSYDTAIWLDWMFYFYLSTIHVVLRKIKHDKPKT